MANDVSLNVSRLYLSGDSAALAVGAEAVADALQAQIAQDSTTQPIELHRTSSRGLFWLEPLLEVDTPQGRVAYGPVAAQDIPALWRAQVYKGGEHPLRLGLVEQLPYLQGQQRVLFARAGVTRPLSLDDYAAHGGWQALTKALQTSPAQVVQSVLDSGLRGRGGAAFPAGIKWQTVAAQTAADKYIVCNADEGDSGTFADRMLMEGDPFALIEGMAIAAHATGAHTGYIYVRSEYPHAVDTLTQAVVLAEQAGKLAHVRLHVRKAAGSYVCGEETALLESLEGKRGMVRAKPPIPALQGLFGCPTLVNNVLTLASVPWIMLHGADAYRALGCGRSLGTMPFQLAGNVRHGGLVELPFGSTLRELVFDFGGGTASGRPVKAIQVGGPLGAYVAPDQWDVPLDYEAYAAMGAVLGHGGIVVHDDSADMARLAQFAMEFCAHESCGKCTPCRIGSTRGAELIAHMRQPGQANTPTQTRHKELLHELCDTMLHGSLCAMGGMTPYPVLSALQHYPQDFGLPTTATATGERHA